MNQVYEVVDKFKAPAFGSLRLEPCLGGAVSEDHGEREPKPAQAGRESHEVKEVKEVEEVEEVKEL